MTALTEPKQKTMNIMPKLPNALRTIPKWSVKTILTTGLVAAGIAAIFLTWSILRVSTTIMDTAVSVSQTYEVITALNKLEANLVSVETSERGYVIAGEPEYLAPYNQALRETHWKLDLISAFTSDDASQRFRLAQLEQLVSAKLKTLQMIVDTREAGAADAAAQLVSLDQDKLELDRIHLVISEMEAYENTILNVRITARDAAYRRFWWSFGTLIIAMFGGAFWQYRLVRRIIRYSEESKEQIRHQAEHDALTGLPNRRLLYTRLDLAIAYAERSEQMLAVMFLDLDGFKAVNDTLGHQAGDELLKCVSARLAQTVRSNDTVARLGGDEFVVVVSELNGIDSATQLASTLIDMISRPYFINGVKTHVSASIGISFYSADGTSGDALLAKADEALNKAKMNGKNQYQFAGSGSGTRSRQNEFRKLERSR